MTMFARLCAAALLFLVAGPALAQAPSASEAPAVVVVAPDPFGRETPRATVTGLLGALGARDYDRAAQYFDLPIDSDPRVANGAGELARRLQTALDSGGTLMSFLELSNDANGRIDDDLPVDRERIGAMGEDRPIMLIRKQQGAGAPVWRISHETIRQLMAAPPSTTAESTATAEEAPPVSVAGAPVWDWLLLIGLAIASYFLFQLVAAGVLWLMRQVIRDKEQSSAYRFATAAAPPLSLLLAVISFTGWAGQVEASIVARQTLLRYIGLAGAVAIAWFALRLVDAIADVTTARMARRDRRQAISIITLARRAAKILLLALSVVAILDTFGIDVTTGVAALGIGGIALALGAQKTVENLVGSVTVVADRPIQVGDFCKVGDVSGTVEDVGIRSTRIRTGERTVITIPNGNFASLQIENFAKRDRFLFNPVIRLEYGVTADQLHGAVETIEGILKAHEKVFQEGPRARFSNFGENALEIEVWSYIATSDFDESLIVRQELLLSILRSLEAAGLQIAVPARNLHFDNNSALA